MDADWLEIWMIAGLLVDEHGNLAVNIAKARADRAMSEHDAVGNAVWCAVVGAAETYLRDAEQSRSRGPSKR